MSRPESLLGCPCVKPRPYAEWGCDDGLALWWRFPVQEPPYCGDPDDEDWPFDEDEENRLYWTSIDGNSVHNAIAATLNRTSNLKFKTGDRVRLVGGRIPGVVVGPAYPSGVDGGDRLPVEWDEIGATTGWHPDFLRPATSLPENDPDEIVSGSTVWRKGRIYVDRHGTLVVDSGWFSRVNPAEVHP